MRERLLAVCDRTSLVRKFRRKDWISGANGAVLRSLQCARNARGLVVAALATAAITSSRAKKSRQSGICRRYSWASRSALLPGLSICLKATTPCPRSAGFSSGKLGASIRLSVATHQICFTKGSFYPIPVSRYRFFAAPRHSRGGPFLFARGARVQPEQLS